MFRKMRSSFFALVLAAGLLSLFPGLSYAAAPATPGGLAVTFTTNSAHLSWSAVSGATGYNVYRAADGSGTYGKVNASAVTSANYTDAGLTASTAFSYKVTAVNADGESL